MKYTATQIKQWDVQSCKYGSRWVPERGLNHKFESWKSRIANAWGVLVGKYDALDWEETK